MSHLQAFEKFLIQKAPHLVDYAIVGKRTLRISIFAGIQRYVQEMYFQDPNGCLPYKYLGQDITNDIRTKFYYPLAFLEWLFKKIHPELVHATLLITIDPSYETSTHFILHLYDEKIVLLEGSWKAWNFWFEDEAEFEDWVNSCLEEMESGLQTVKKVKKCLSSK
jgi:hypothetical protein